MKRQLIYPLILLLFTYCKQTKEKKVVWEGDFHESYNSRNFRLDSTNNEVFMSIYEEGYSAGSSPVCRYRLTKPLERIVCTSTTHLPFLEMLGAEDKLVGFANTHYISSEKMVKRVKDGLIQEVGSEEGLNIEVILSLKPDAVITYDTDMNSRDNKKLTELGIPVICNTDFLENTPLAKADWLLFFGILLNKYTLADSIINKITERYLNLKKMTDTVSYKPTIMTGVMYGGSWFVPGALSWSAKYFDDAGGNYLWKADSTTGAIQKSFESVYVEAMKADYWLNTGNYTTKEGLLTADGRYASFRAFHNGKMYNYHKKLGHDGGFDYFESGVARPDLVLKDLIKILHPNLLPNHESIYYDQLK